MNLITLLSLISPSCIVVFNRELVNTLSPFITSTHSNLLKQYNINIDMEINTSRGKLANASANSSRAMSAHSSISSISYVERMEV